MAGGGDRLSELPDDLLRRVLHFAPLREAASTTALSRRWRAPLWPSSGAVNLETGDIRCSSDNPRSFTRRDDFVSAATGALDAAIVPVTRLTLRLDADLHELVGDDFDTWRRRITMDMMVVPRCTDLVHTVLSHREARRVEELRVVAKDLTGYHCIPDHRGLFRVTLDSLRMETLRVLELAHCKGLLDDDRQAAAVVLPRLSYCRQHLSSLQQVIDAALALATVHLQSVCVDATDEQAKEGTTRHLRCPAATVLVLDRCRWEEERQSLYIDGYNYKRTREVHAVEIDATKLRRFRFKGPLRSFSFNPQPKELEQVDLDFSGYVPSYSFDSTISFSTEQHKGKNKDPCLTTFWQFTRSFTYTKEMRLRVNHLEDIAVLNEDKQFEILPAFRRLERLEVQGAHSTKIKAAAMTVLNILHCCPVLTSFRINLDDTSIIKGCPEHRLMKRKF